MSELASFSESSRQTALQRFQLLRAHLEDGRSLAAVAREAKISYIFQFGLGSALPRTTILHLTQIPKLKPQIPQISQI